MRRGPCFVGCFVALVALGCDGSVAGSSQAASAEPGWWRHWRPHPVYGLGDAGAATSDGGAAAIDAGAASTDAGTAAEDAGAPAMDAGTTGAADAGTVGSDAGTDSGSTSGGTTGALSVRVTAIDSARVSIAWPGVTDAESITVELGAEPPGSDRRLAGAVTLATLAATATSYDATPIAAGTDAFLRVAVRRRDGTTVAGAVHARTGGGRGAPLATPLRSVHAYGPSMLAIVLHDGATRYDSSTTLHTGDDGAAWQAGTWTVLRADGRPIAIRTVRRTTEPVGQWSYPVGYEMWPDDRVVDLEHVVFLELAEAIGARDVLRVTHTGATGTALDVRVPFSDRYLETPLVQVNQVGYNPRASKRWAYVSGWVGTGAADTSAITTADVLVEPIDPLAARRTAVAALPVSLRASADTEAGGAVREIDLAGVPPAEGVRYRVRLPGVGVSVPTAVSEDAALRAFWTTARGLFHNRWCGDLRPSTTEWSRPADHCSAYFVTGRRYGEGMFPSTTPQTNARAVRGGHHDAGDFDIRPFHVLVGQYLLRAYEIDAWRFTDGQLVVPESGNGIPDLLDEALWSVAAWQALQNADGSVRAGVESWAHPRGIYLANEDRLPYWTYDAEAWHTAYATALFAQAARLVRPFDATRSTELERAARLAYDAPIFASAPVSYRLYAASELYALTGEPRYRGDFEARWREMNRYGGGAFDNFQVMTKIYPGAFTGYAPAMADFVMGYATRGGDATIVATIQSRMRSRADAAAAAILSSPHAHRNGRETTDPPDWGHTTSTGRHADTLYQALQLGGLTEEARQRYFDAMSVAADYALGCNPAGTTWITGLGTRSPRQALHNDSLAFIARGMPPVPGIPVYGPVARLPSVYYYEPVANAYEPAFGSRPPALRYSDNRTSVNTAELSVWEMQAPFAELFATLLAAGMTPPPTWLPGAPHHRHPTASHFAE